MQAARLSRERIARAVELFPVRGRVSGVDTVQKLATVNVAAPQRLLLTQEPPQQREGHAAFEHGHAVRFLGGENSFGVAVWVALAGELGECSKNADICEWVVVVG